MASTNRAKPFREAALRLSVLSAIDPIMGLSFGWQPAFRVR